MISGAQSQIQRDTSHPLMNQSNELMCFIRQKSIKSHALQIIRSDSHRNSVCLSKLEIYSSFWCCIFLGLWRKEKKNV